MHVKIIAVLLIALVASYFPLTTQQTANAVLFTPQTTRGFDWTNTLNADGTYTFSAGLPKYIQSGNGTFVPYNLSQNSTTIKIETNEGSFTFNKNSCSLSFYNGGIISGQQPTISSDSYNVLAELNGTTNWSNVSIINNASCQTSVQTAGDIISIIATKSVSGAGIFSVNYTKIPGVPLKTTFSATNQNPSWTKYHIGLRQIIEVPQSITLGNVTYNLSQYNKTVLDRTWINNHKAQLITLSKNVFFNMGPGWNNVNDIIINWDGTQASLFIDYTYNTPILQPGHTITVDPTFGYTSTGSKRIFKLTGDTTSVTDCTTYPPDTSDTVPLIRFDPTGIGNTCSLPIQRWDLSSLPHGIIVSSATIKYDVASVTNPRNCLWNHIANDPNTATIAQTFTDLTTGTNYASDAGCTSSGSGKTVSLPSSAYTDIAAGAGSFFAVGVYYSGARDGSTHTTVFSNTPGATPISLTFTYGGVPLTPTIIKVNTLNSTAINATWNKPTGATWFWFNATLSGGGTTHINTTKTTLTLNNYTAGSRYTFSIEAGNGTGKSLGSVTKFNYTYNVAPTGPTISSITSNQARLSWTNPGGGANLTGGFKIYKASPNSGTYTLAGTTTNSTNRFDLTSLLSDVQYITKISTRYAVGINYSGLSANSTTVSFYTLPSPPTSLTVSQVVPLVAHLSWTAAGDNGTQTGFKIEQSVDGGTTWTVKIANTGNSTTHADVTESNAGKYKFRVSSIKYGGTSIPSNVVSITLYDLFTVREYHHDGITPVYGEAIQANSTSSNNRFTLVSGLVTIGGLTGNNNFTAWNSLINFIVGKQYNVNATSQHSLNMTTNDYDIDCGFTGPGVDVELWTNGTDGHQITTFSTPTCFSNNTIKWSTKFTAGGNNLNTFNTLVYVKVINATYATNATLKYNTTSVNSLYTAPYIISSPVSVGTGLQTKLFNWSMNLKIAPGFIPVNFTVGHISVSGVNPVTVPIKFSTDIVNSSATAVTVTFPSTYTMGYNVTFGNEAKTLTYTGLPVTSPSLGVGQSVITFKNPGNDFVTIKAYDLTSKTSGSYILAQPNTNVPFVTQFQNFKNGLFGTSAMIGGINIVDLIVLIVAMIGLNRANEIVGAFMMVIIVGVAGFFQIITWPTAMVSGIALAVLVTVVTMKKYQNS